jgi:K+-transporting ATPase A subunit
MSASDANFVELLAILLIPMAQVFMFGRVAEVVPSQRAPSARTWASVSASFARLSSR